MPWYHHIAAFLHHNLPQMRATRRTNLALLTAAILNRRALSLSELARPWMPGLPQSHHQRKKRHFRFLSNPRFDPIQTQCALMPAICHLAGLKGLTPIMIDWSDLGRKRNGLFAAVCYRKRGLPLLSWATTHDELTPSQNRLEETFIARLLRNLPDNIRPLLLADRGFGRASLLRRLQEMPRHTGRTVDYVVRLKGNVHIQDCRWLSGIAAEVSPASKSLCVSAWGSLSFRWGSDGEPGTVLGSGASGTLVFGDIAAGRQGGAVSQTDAAGAVLSRWQAVFRLGSGNGNHHGAAGAYAGGATVGVLFAAVGGAAGVVAVPAAGVFVGEAGAAAAGHGMLSGYAGTTAQVVRLAPHLKVGTPEDTGATTGFGRAGKARLWRQFRSPYRAIMAPAGPGKRNGTARRGVEQALWTMA